MLFSESYLTMLNETSGMSVTAEVPLTMAIDNRTGSGSRVTPLVSFAVMDMFSVVNGFALTSIISIFGIFTNTANIIVYCRMGLSESSNINFLALSVIDFFVSFITFFLKLFFSSYLRQLSTGPVTFMISNSLGPAMLVAVGGSALMTALISTERWFCVVFPLQVRIIECVFFHQSR